MPKIDENALPKADFFQIWFKFRGKFVILHRGLERGNKDMLVKI